MVSTGASLIALLVLAIHSGTPLAGITKHIMGFAAMQGSTMRINMSEGERAYASVKEVGCVGS